MLLQIHEDNDNYLAIWYEIVAALKFFYLNYGIWVHFVDFALKIRIIKSKKSAQRVVLPDIPATEWRKYANTGLSLFPSCPALLYLRAMAYLEEGDLPCSARLLSESCPSNRSRRPTW